MLSLVYTLKQYAYETIGKQQRDGTYTRSYNCRTGTAAGLPKQGVAIALHNRMVPRAEWENTALNEGDSLVIIKAACGG